MQSKGKIVSLISCSVLLAACGGGGGDAGNSNGSVESSNTITTGTPPAATSTVSLPSTQKTLAFSGVVAVGAPLANAKVTVKCIAGIESVLTDQGGNFVVELKNAALPCVARAALGNLTLHSATETEGTFNITTLSDLMLARLAKSEPSSFYEGFDSAKSQLVAAAGLQDAQRQVRFVLPYMILSNKTDFVTTKFVADGKDTMDAALDVIGKGFDATGIAALRRDLAGIETLQYGGSFTEEFSQTSSIFTSGVTVDPKEPRKFYLNATISTPVYANGGTLSESKSVLMVADYARKTLQQFPTSSTGMGLSFGTTLDPNTPNRFLSVGMSFGTTSQMALKESNDYGMTWQQISAPNGFQSITPQIDGNVRYLRFSTDGSTMFAYSTEEGSGLSAGAASYIAMSVNGGATWQRPQGFTNDQVGPIYVSPANPSVVYAINNGKFLKSSDKGLTFTTLPALPNSPAYNLISQPVAVDPFDANTLYSVPINSAGVVLNNTNPLKVFKSTDGGNSWLDIKLAGCCDSFLPATLTLANRNSGLKKIYFSSNIKGLLYFPFRGDASNLQMLRSKDGGATWKMLSFSRPSSTPDNVLNSVMSQGYFPLPIYSTAQREDGGVDLYVRSLDGKGIDRFIDYLGMR